MFHLHFVRFLPLAMLCVLNRIDSARNIGSVVLTRPGNRTEKRNRGKQSLAGQKASLGTIGIENPGTTAGTNVASSVTGQKL